CGIFFGAFPAAHASNVSAQHTLLRARGAGGSARTNALRRILLAVEVALALVLLTGAGLMVRTLHGLTTIDPGFRADHLLTMHLSTAGARWTDPRRQTFVDAAMTRIRAVPGVSGAAVVSAPVRQVVGVVRGVKFQGVGEPTPMQIYMPFAQDQPADFFVLARTAGNPVAAVDSIESIIRGLDRDLPVFKVRSMTALMDTD